MCRLLEAATCLATRCGPSAHLSGDGIGAVPLDPRHNAPETKGTKGSDLYFLRWNKQNYKTFELHSVRKTTNIGHAHLLVGLKLSEQAHRVTNTPALVDQDTFGHEVLTAGQRRRPRQYRRDTQTAAGTSWNVSGKTRKSNKCSAKLSYVYSDTFFLLFAQKQ